jgi:photosystem II stability/assembly factor-like uncharacterized protein
MNENDLEHADLVEELAALTPIEWPPDEAGDRITHSVLQRWSSQQGKAGRQPTMRTRRLGLGVLAGSCAALLVLTLVLMTVVMPQHSSNKAPTTAGPRSSLAGRGSPTSVKWQLVSDTSSPWRTVGLKTSPRFHLSCPSDNTCYTLGQGAAGSQIVTQLAVTNDGGNSWSSITLPTEIGVQASFSCASADTCAVLGADLAGKPVFLETTDGGQTWSARAGPPEVNTNTMINIIHCLSATTCLAVVSGHKGSGASAVALTTSDGGASWSRATLPASFTPFAAQCLPGGTCVVTGFDSATTDDSVAALYSTNGGATWSPATVPPGTGLPQGLSCADAADCLTISFSRGTTARSTVLRSTDGGASWTDVSAIGLRDALVTGISCPATTECWASGLVDPGNIVPVGDRRGLLALSTDQGQSWQPAQLPDGVWAIVSVSCPSTNKCYAFSLVTPHTGTAIYGLLTNSSS